MRVQKKGKKVNRRVRTKMQNVEELAKETDILAERYNTITRTLSGKNTAQETS